MFLQTHDIRHNLHALGSYISRVSISGFPPTTPTHVSGDETSSMGVTDRVPPFPLWCAESECRSGSTMQDFILSKCGSRSGSSNIDFVGWGSLTMAQSVLVFGFVSFPLLRRVLYLDFFRCSVEASFSAGS
ncbi:hypothetical protein F2Q70_00015937 [Brassica cretica]|uniref:Uncharacterized protein n=1 Tax=Brassica cretica TaxID=69181 RepID=A0A8S9I3V8_BRACR|nr:hypothetical protein F2Q70_00015937 [Brassica cretica]